MSTYIDKKDDLPVEDDKVDALDALIEEQEREDLEHLKELDVSWRDVPSLILFAVLFITVFMQFFTRYALNNSLAFTEELARYLLILITFVAAIRCQLKDSHIRLEFVDDLAARFARPLKIFALTLSTGFFSVATYSLWILIERTWRQQMVSLPFPKYYLYSLVFASLICLIAVHIWQLWKLFKRESK